MRPAEASDPLREDIRLLGGLLGATVAAARASSR
jgi:hypothetical protein